ncbi:MAG TPA: DUF4339 domain-containing protein [Thermoanaerobaculia bacterium]|jgi:hypothetical protein
MSEDLWYYAQGGAQKGPVTFAELREMATSSRLAADDLIWRPGLSGWSPASSVQGVMPEANSGPPPLAMVAPPAAPFAGAGHDPYADRGRAFLRTAARRARQLGDAGEQAETMPHIRMVGRLLEVLKGVFHEAFLDQIDSGARRVGHIAYVAAALLFFLFYSVLAVKVDSMQIFFGALLGILPLAVVGHYTAVMFLDAGSRLIPSLPSRLFSAAFLRCTGLIFFFGALGPLLGGLFLLVKTNDWATFGVSLAVSAVLVYMGAVCLNPASLSVEVDEKAGAGEEALGILSFVMKMMLRLSPIVFGVGAGAGVGAAVYLLVLVLRDEFLSLGFPIVADLTVTELTGQILAVGLVPFLAYLAFVFLYLVLDVLRAILSVPGKLDAMRQAAGGE